MSRAGISPGRSDSMKQYARDSKQIWSEAIAGMVQTWNAGS
jgi:hypothetical protein